jgi:hypothetical protein
VAKKKEEKREERTEVAAYTPGGIIATGLLVIRDDAHASPNLQWVA